jgi:hypothetical protein
MLNETHRAPPRYKISDFFSSLLGRPSSTNVGASFGSIRYDKISKNAFTIGSVFPLTKRTEFEIYYEDQRDSGTSPNFHVRGAGLVLSLYF